MRWFHLTRFVLLFAFFTGHIAWAQGAYEPQRGTQERKDLMNAVRPFAEQHLGAPVQFVVEELTVNGTVGYAALHAQRPGGVQIDMRSTPDARRYGYDENMYPGIFALFSKKGGTWVLEAGAYSPFEPPFMDAKTCASHAAVLMSGWCR